MARTTPPGIDPVPTPPIQRGDRATFSSRVDAFILWLVNAVTQFGSLATNVYNNAVDAFQSATSAGTSATNASTSAANSAGSATAASNSATAAAGSATAAATSATASAASAVALTSTSTTANTLDTGNKTFVTQAGKQFVVNGPITAVDAGNPANRMSGYVSAYSGTNLTMVATSYEGTGSASNWNITVSGTGGARGATGGLTGANLTGPLNFAKSTDVASTGTLDIWNTTGNIVPVTGSATVTGFTTAPQAGSTRRIIAKGAFTLTSGANLVVKGGTFTATVGDEIDVVAETTTLFKVTRVPSAGLRPMTVILTSGSAWVVPSQDFVLEAVAGGSGGSGIQSSSDGVGGRCGGYVKKVFNGATVGSTALISIGTAGAAGTANGVGGAGGNTTFTLSGFTTVTASATSTSSGGEIILNSVKGGYRGGQIGSGVSGGQGASTLLGIGGLGDLGAGPAGRGFGAGGAGGGTDVGGVAGAGGAGAPGVIIITYLG